MKIADVLNIVPLFNRHLIEAFEVFSPEYLVVNANDGTFNRDIFLEKEQKLAFFVLNNNTRKKTLCN